jgi:hypothetical protein
VENTGSRLVGVIVVNAAIWVVLWFVRRGVPVLGKRGDSGLYMILLPLGFGLWGFDLPYWATAPIILIGLAELLLSFRMAFAAAQRAQET